MESYCIEEWLEENKQNFSPPACNKCMFQKQLTIMFVGGPNQRKDYHIEEGEEFFYQLKGEMCLKVVEKGVFKDVVIKQGEMFMLPARVQHSPQRFANTVGLVVERRRALHEKDGLKYFVEDGSQPLFERWFHLQNIEKDLPPVFQEFYQSEAYKTGKPTKDSVVPMSRPFEPDCVTELEQPINYKEWLAKSEAEIQQVGFKVLFGSPKFKAEIAVYGSGTHSFDENPGETFLWQEKGKSQVNMPEFVQCTLSEGHATKTPEQARFTLNVSKSGMCLVVQMQPTL